MSSPASPSRSDRRLVALVLSSNPSEVIVAETTDADLDGDNMFMRVWRAVCIGGMLEGASYGRDALTFMQEPARINVNQIVLLSTPTDSLRRFHERFWGAVGNQSASKADSILDSFFNANNNEDPKRRPSATRYH